MNDAPELQDVTEFLQKQHPFTLLPPDAIRAATKTLKITYFPAGRRILSSGDANELLYIVRSGAVDITDSDGILAERCGEGDFFGFPSVLTELPTQFNSDTIEDTLVYILPGTSFHQLRRDYPVFDQHFVTVHSQKILDTNAATTRKPMPLTTRIKHMVKRPPVVISPDGSVQSAALRMRDERVSCLIVVQDEQLMGIITDRDIRNRVVAEELAYTTPIRDIMTRDPLTIDSSQQSFEAQMLMSQHNIHHLPVLEDGHLTGLITTTDILRLQAGSSVHLIGEIEKQDSPEMLASVLSRLPQLVISLVDADATAYDIGHIISHITDAVTRRLLQLAELALGPAPIEYVWLAFGSQGRREQTARTDQDNGLLLAETPDDNAKAYFAKLAKFVCDGLNTCGYEYCPGDVMATTWCYSLEEWQAKFRHWLDHPDPEDLLKVTIFFDMRPIQGDETLVDTLMADILERAHDNAVFLASMAQNALGFQPPLGFFRQFVLERGGEHHHTLNMKQRGVTPIIDMTRVYALAYSIPASNTTERLKYLVPTPAIAPEDGANLIDALEFIAHIRIRHQGQQIAYGRPPDNLVDPDSLSSFERQHLKTAFNIVRRMQTTLSNRYQTGLFG